MNDSNQPLQALAQEVTTRTKAAWDTIQGLKAALQAKLEQLVVLNGSSAAVGAKNATFTLEDKTKNEDAEKGAASLSFYGAFGEGQAYSNRLFPGSIEISVVNKISKKEVLTISESVTAVQHTYGGHTVDETVSAILLPQPK
jgi:hypothetical protein